MQIPFSARPLDFFATRPYWFSKGHFQELNPLDHSRASEAFRSIPQLFPLALVRRLPKKCKMAKKI